MSRNSNVFEAIAANGSDLNFVPRVARDFQPTKAPAGSPEKIEVLRWRLLHGYPLWHESDSHSSLPQRGAAEMFYLSR